jgi:acetyl esterase
MVLDPQVKLVVDGIASMGLPPFEELTPEEARVAVRAFTPLMGPPEEVAGVEEVTAPGPGGPVPIRLYRPLGAPEGPLPVVLQFHWGGFTFGDVDMFDANNRHVANQAKCLLAAVTYRLAPEHRFPAALEDAWAATIWVAESAASLGADPSRLAVSGESAGGNLAAVVARRARDRGGPPICFQLLVFPWCDVFSFDTPSYKENGESYVLTRSLMEWYRAHYLGPDNDGSDPDVSPLRTPDLSGLPPALVITAEYDPLRDEGEAYAARLAEAGVEVELHRYDGQIHVFTALSAVVDAGRAALDEGAAALRRAFGS